MESSIMFTAIILSVVLVSLCSGAPTAETKAKAPVAFLQNDHIVDEAGQFSLGFSSVDGIRYTKQGALVPNDEGDGYVMAQQGEYSFISPEGVEVKMAYIADKDGFRVTGYPLPAQAKA
ncbi:endocuticle structural glycoprotein SgAbd-2-like [Adelges cooleyi]|uniref:endocuticle structural glycoprotein SgAbd-2-like n=1 Tax=Adelges cooleyi TaxID=133065 RepID=UPI00217F62B8|nr:endocuticle structural glycoprotein SgAbd-2-like [Adelges cooleyi]